MSRKSISILLLLCIVVSAFLGSNFNREAEAIALAIPMALPAAKIVAGMLVSAGVTFLTMSALEMGITSFWNHVGQSTRDEILSAGATNQRHMDLTNTHVNELTTFRDKLMTDNQFETGNFVANLQVPEWYIIRQWGMIAPGGQVGVGGNLELMQPGLYSLNISGNARYRSSLNGNPEVDRFNIGLGFNLINFVTISAAINTANNTILSYSGSTKFFVGENHRVYRDSTRSHFLYTMTSPVVVLLEGVGPTGRPQCVGLNPLYATTLTLSRLTTLPIPQNAVVTQVPVLPQRVSIPATVAIPQDFVTQGITHTQVPTSPIPAVTEFGTLGQILTHLSAMINSVISVASQTLTAVSTIATTLTTNFVGDFNAVTFPAISTVTTRFPFSLPWDLQRILLILNAEPVAPAINMNISAPFNANFTLELDTFLTETFMQRMRLFMLLMYTIGLIYTTTKIFGGQR